VLARSGVLVTAGRRGTTVAPRSRSTLRYRRAVDTSNSVQLDLSTGVPDPLLLPDLRSAVRALTETAAPGSYLDPPLLPDLEGYLKGSWPFPVDTLAIVDGAMDAIDLIARALLAYGDRVVVETPCFPPLLDLLESCGAKIMAVGLDAEGLNLEALRAAAQSARAVFLQPRAQNPTGVSMTARRAERIAELLSGTGTVVIEDDSWAAVAQADPVSIGRWIPDQTVYVRSYSKSHGPDLRIAAVSGPGDLMRSVGAIRQYGQGWTSRILQRILFELLTDATATAVVERARHTYAQRRHQLVAALGEHDIHVVGADGFNVWVPVADETSAVLHLANLGIGVASGAPFQTQIAAPAHIRVTASTLDRDFAVVAAAIAEAARGLQRVIV